MKATLLRERKAGNPLWSARDASSAARTKRPYPVPREITLPVGYTYDLPTAWTDCVPGPGNSEPAAKPADEECRAAVIDWMERKRPVLIEQIKQIIANPPSDQATREFYQQLAVQYGLDRGSDPITPKVHTEPIGSTSGKTATSKPDPSA